MAKRFIASFQGFLFTVWGFWVGSGIVPKGRNIIVTGVPGYGGGPFTFLKLLLLNLKGDFTVHCSFNNSQISDEIEVFCSTNGIRLHRRPDGGWLGDLLNIAILARQLKPRMVLANVGTFSQAFHLLALPVPILYYSHSIWHHPLSAELDAFLSFFGRYRNHKIFTVSAAAKDSLDQVYFSNRTFPSPVSWLHNGVEDRLDVPKGPPPGRQIVLTLGSVAWYKNPELWQRVARKVVAQVGSNQVRFVWAGQGELLEKLAAENSDAVEFIGFDPHPDGLIQQSSIYFQPSEFESFGLGVCEAMMFGRPVVATEVGALPELVTNGVEGFLVPVDQEDTMVSRLVQLIQDEGLRTTMGAAARARYLGSFTERKWSDSFHRLLKEHFLD